MSTKFYPLLVAILICLLALESIGQVTVTLGTGTSTTQSNPTGPSPYNTNADNRAMQFLYTATEIKTAGGSEGEIVSIAWKVEDTTDQDMKNYTIWMKNTSAKDVSSHDSSGHKLVKKAFTYKPGKAGWQTIQLDSVFDWDGTSNILFHVCFGGITTASSAGTVFIYSNSANQRRGIIGRSSVCGNAATIPFSWKPFVQMVIRPKCLPPNGMSVSNITANSGDAKWTQSISKPQGYEYFVTSSSTTQPTKGTYITDTVADLTGLCPNKLNFLYLRSVCGTGDTSDWSTTYIFQTKSGGGITSNSPICVGDTLEISVEPAVSYVWSGPNGFKSSNQQESIVNAQMNQSGTYTVAITDTNSCLITYSATIKVDTVPSAIIFHNSPLCAGDTLYLDVQGSESYLWSGPAGFSSDTNHIIIPAIDTSNGGMYWVELKNGSNCKSDTSVTIQVNPKPVISVSSNSPICEKDSLIFISTGNYSYQWSGPSGYSSIAQNIVIPSAQTTNSGEYEVKATSAENCTTKMNVTAEVKPNPDISLTPGDTSVCELTPFQLMASGANSHKWYYNGAFIDTGNMLSKSTAFLQDSGNYSVHGLQVNGCSDSASVLVTILPSPITSIQGPSEICEGEELRLKGETSGKSWSWEGPMQFASTQLEIAFDSVIGDQDGNYIFIGLGENGCRGYAVHKIDVLPKPLIEIDKQGNNLVATAGFSNYQWFLDGEEIDGETSRLLTAQGLGNYTVKVIGANGCENTSKEVQLTSLSSNKISLDNEWVISPNPVTNIITISSLVSLGQILVVNATGQTLLKVQTINNQLIVDMTEFPAGTYYIRRFGDNLVSNQVLIKL